MKSVITLFLFSSLSIYAGEGSSGGGPKLVNRIQNDLLTSIESSISENDLFKKLKIKNPTNHLSLQSGEIINIDAFLINNRQLPSDSKLEGKTIVISKENISDILLKNDEIIPSSSIKSDYEILINKDSNIKDIQLINGDILKIN